MVVLLMIGVNCSLFASKPAHLSDLVVNDLKDVVNRPKVRTDQTQGSDFGLKIGTRTDARLPNELVFGYTFQDEMEIHQMRTRASPTREVISCLEVEFVASTCSKLLERASLGGFRAGKRERSGPRGNPFVV